MNCDYELAKANFFPKDSKAKIGMAYFMEEAAFQYRKLFLGALTDYKKNVLNIIMQLICNFAPKLNHVPCSDSIAQATKCTCLSNHNTSSALRKVEN